MILCYLDKNGNPRPPETWDEVKKSLCNNWDSCSPCMYAHGFNPCGGGWNCTHPLNPKYKGVSNG